MIAVFAVVAMLPMYFYGVPGGNDQQQHYQFAWTVYRSVSAGELYPSVDGETNRGFGDVGLRFYPPLTYYVLAFGYGLTGDWLFASLVAFTLVFFMGGLGVYLWAREELDRETALIAGAVYTFASYHLNLIYTNGLMAEFFASAIVPFCFLFLTRLCRRGGWIDVLGLSTTFALLILTHLPITILGSIAMCVYALLLTSRKNLLRVAPQSLTSAALALAMSAFYWARMLPELDWVKHSSHKYFDDTWSYAANYLLYPSHFTRFGEDALNLWLADMMLVATILIAVPSVVVFMLGNRKQLGRYIVAVGVVGAFSVVMSTPVSSVVWDHFDMLQKVQFPWRWLSIVTASGAVFAAVGIKRAAEMLTSGKHHAVAAGIASVLIVFVFTGVFIMKGATYTPAPALNDQVASTPSATGCECWWPVWAEWPALGQTERIVANGRAATIGAWYADHKTFEIAPGQPTAATIAVFYYPLWHATVNGNETQIARTDDGRLSVPVPAERSNVRLMFREPARVTAAYVISMISWVGVIGLAAALVFKNTRPAKSL